MNLNSNWAKGLPQSLHFVGVAGTGMSAIAQFAAWHGLSVSGSDRQFHAGETPMRGQLEALGIRCVSENLLGITEVAPKALVVSTAIEADHPQLVWAKQAGIPIFHRSEMLQRITQGFRTIAVAGTSGKSTTSAMLFHVMRACGMSPSVITGAALTELQQEGWIGNAWAGEGEWLVIEADESDGTLERYAPEIGLFLNVDRDHKELDELMVLFKRFRSNIQSTLIVNADQQRASQLSMNQCFDFGTDPNVGFSISEPQVHGLSQEFKVAGARVHLPLPGAHNRSNAAAAIAAAVRAGAPLVQACASLANYQGIYRRFQMVDQWDHGCVVDDFAHNPAKIIAALRAAQSLGPKVRAWFQPHGFAPTKFMREELAQSLAECLRPEDEFVFSEIYYAGGTAARDISSLDLVNDLQDCVAKVSYCEHRSDLATFWSAEDAIYLLMGARDPSLGSFVQRFADEMRERRGLV
jgi:UDP-N-acetylmuramate--alanine ligase